MSRISVVCFGIVLLLLGNAWSPGHAVAEEVAGPGQRLVYLMFADGHTAIPGGETCRGSRVPPAYHCARAGTEASPEPCRREIIGYLERWFGAFEIAFTTSPPATPHDTVVITSRRRLVHGAARAASAIPPASASRRREFPMSTNAAPPPSDVPRSSPMNKGTCWGSSTC